MNPDKSTRQLRFSRRAFLHRGLAGIGLAGLSGPWGIDAETDATPSRLVYSLDRWRRTDPKLVRYREVARFHCLRPGPRRIVVGPSNRLYLVAGRFLSVGDESGRVERELTLAGPARCVAVAGDGTLYIGLRDHIEVYDAQGQRRAGWESPAGRPFFTGAAVSGDEVFVADAGNRVVLRYDRLGKLVRRIGERNPARNIPGFIVPSPFFDVEFAPDGLLRVNNPGRHRVEAYTVDGDFEFAWGKPSAGIGGFCGCCNPIGLALLADGRCVTCEKGLPRVKVYDARGGFESVVAGPESFTENARASAGEDSTRGGLDVAVDGKGRVYILDWVAAEVRVMARKEAAPG